MPSIGLLLISQNCEFTWDRAVILEWKVSKEGISVIFEPTESELAVFTEEINEKIVDFCVYKH